MKFTRVSENTLDFDKGFLQQLMNPNPSTNIAHLQAIKQALPVVLQEELTERQRQIILMHYYEGLKDAQIARELEICPSTILRTRRRAEKRIYHALRFLVNAHLA